VLGPIAPVVSNGDVVWQLVATTDNAITIRSGAKRRTHPAGFAEEIIVASLGPPTSAINR
jgi:hypothetical protein